TCLEAFAVGRPIVSYGAPAGHSPTLAKAMHSLGVASYVRRRRELGSALASAAAAALPPVARSAADEVLGTRIRVYPTPTWQRRVRRVALAGVIAGTAYVTASSETAFALVTRGLDFGPVAALATERPQVGLVIETRPGDAGVLGALVARDGGSASFAFPRTPALVTRRMLGARDDDLVVQL